MPRRTANGGLLRMQAECVPNGTRPRAPVHAYGADVSREHEFDEQYFPRLEGIRDHWWVRGMRHVGAALLGPHGRRAGARRRRGAGRHAAVGARSRGAPSRVGHRPARPPSRSAGRWDSARSSRSSPPPTPVRRRVLRPRAQLRRAPAPPRRRRRARGARVRTGPRPWWPGPRPYELRPRAGPRRAARRLAPVPTRHAAGVVRGERARGRRAHPGEPRAGAVGDAMHPPAPTTTATTPARAWATT